VSDKSLVIVESPAKAKTIAAFLGPDFIVESSIGHIRDLPRRASDVPLKYKKESWARLGVDVDSDFKPLYIIDADKRDHIKRLKTLLSGADRLYLATDEDREGRVDCLALAGSAGAESARAAHGLSRDHEESHPTGDREPAGYRPAPGQCPGSSPHPGSAVRYEVSPVLWKKVMPKLSAGRVQSVSTRIVVEREIARMRFVLAQYWDVDGTFATADGSQFQATLVVLDGRRVASGKDFDEDGKLNRAEVFVLNAEQAKRARRSRCRRPASASTRWSRSPIGAALRRRS
jgi:DNA topoisomerase-1